MDTRFTDSVIHGPLAQTKLDTQIGSRHAVSVCRIKLGVTVNTDFFKRSINKSLSHWPMWANSIYVSSIEDWTNLVTVCLMSKESEQSCCLVAGCGQITAI